MKHVSPSGLRITKSILILNVFLLLVPGTNWPPKPTTGLFDDVTPTMQELETETSTPPASETSTPEPTLTAISIDFTPTLGPAAEPVSLLSDRSIGGEFVSNEVIVRLRGNTSEAAIEQCAAAMNGSIVSDIDELHVVVLSIPEERVAQSLFEAATCPGLVYAEPNYLVSISDVVPSDPGWSNQYGLTSIRAPQGWELATGSSAITIAILDSGIDLNHLDLGSKLVGGIDLVNNDNIPQDDNGHGTHVAGIAAASSDNGVGVAGVSWGARLMPIKVLNAAGNGTYADVANGIIWATDHGAHVINLSLGGGSPSQLLEDAVDYAVSKGVLLVAATGNSGTNLVLYPAHYSNVVAVAASDASNAHAAFSNYGPEVDLAAPGVAIYSTAPGGYGLRNGTSMATPYVSGLAAILLGLPGNTSPSAVKQQMQNTALDLGSAGFDDFFGHGLIQMDAAIQAVGVIATKTSNPGASNNTSASLLAAPGGFVQIPTLTPTETLTPVLTFTETATVHPDATSTTSPDASSTPTAEVVALEATELQTSSRIPGWLLPCAGILFILLGILLFWLATRNRRRSMRGRSLFSTKHRFKR